MGADDVGRAVAFWSQALGFEPVSFAEDDNDFTILVPPSGLGTRIALQRAEKGAQITPADVQRVAEKYLAIPDNYTLVIVK